MSATFKNFNIISKFNINNQELRNSADTAKSINWNDLVKPFVCKKNNTTWTKKNRYINQKVRVLKRVGEVDRNNRSWVNNKNFIINLNKH
jgi:endonuclease I